MINLRDVRNVLRTGADYQHYFGDGELRCGVIVRAETEQVMYVIPALSTMVKGKDDTETYFYNLLAALQTGKQLQLSLEKKGDGDGE